MSRRRVAEKRENLPDPKYGDQTLAKFINMIMQSGKKSVAEKIVYGALGEMGEKGKGEPLELFTKALETSSQRLKLSLDVLVVQLIRCQ